MPLLRSVGLRGGGAASAPSGDGPDGTQDHWIATIQASQVDSALSDYTFYVDLGHPDMPAHFWSNVQADGGDIRVTSADGTTQFPVELVSIDTGAETGEVHCLVPSVLSSVDTSVRVYYNASSTLSQPSVGDTYGRNAVWSDHAVVMHMSDDPSGGTITDSTGNGNDGTANGFASGDLIAGKVGDGLNFNGGDYIEIADDPTLTLVDSGTLSVWAKLDDHTTDALQAFADKTNLATADNQYALSYDNRSSQSSPERVRWFNNAIAADASTTTANWAPAGSTLESWTLMHGVRTTNRNRLYANGALEDTATQDSPAGEDNSNPLRLGQRTSDLNFPLNGALDEFRLTTVTRDVDWISAEYTNQNAPATFYTVTTP